MNKQYAIITVNRASPSSIDPYYSSRGHDPQICSGLIEPGQAAAWIEAHAPEVVPDSDGEWYRGRDRRSYFTTVHVRTA